MAAGNKVTLSAFAGRPTRPIKRHSDDELDALFDSWSQKEAEREEVEAQSSTEDFDRTFEEAFDIGEWNEDPVRGHHQRDVREPDETTLEGTLETVETLETATEEVLSQEDEEEDDDDDSHVYDEFKEDLILSDEDESTEAYSDISSIVQDKETIRSEFQPPEFSCVDNDVIKEKFTLVANQAGSNLDELNQFLCKELELHGFVEEIGELKREVASNGLHKLEGVNWSALVDFVLPRGLHGKKTEIESGILAIEDGKELGDEKDGAEQTPFGAGEEDLPHTSSWCSSMNDFADFTMEEGMEIPYVSCSGSSSAKETDSSSGKETEKKRRHSILAKIIERKSTKSHDADELVEVVAVPAVKPVMRLRLQDGSMATVSIETAAKLTNCNWV